MSFGMKAMRTVVWLSILAGLFALPILFVVPRLTGFLAGSGMPLALPFRLVMWTSSALRWPLIVALIAVTVGVVIQAAVSRVSPMDVIRLLFTWREEDWATPAGRRLERHSVLPTERV